MFLVSCKAKIIIDIFGGTKCGFWQNLYFREETTLKQVGISVHDRHTVWIQTLQKWHDTALKAVTHFFFLKKRKKLNIKLCKYSTWMRHLPLRHPPFSRPCYAAHSLFSLAILSRIYFEPGGGKRCNIKWNPTLRTPYY